MSMRVCAEVGCPVLVPPSAYRGRCAEHRKERDTARGTKTQRGYGSTIHDTPLGRMTYDQCRTTYRDLQRRGQALACWRCGRELDQDWHLGHDDVDRRVIAGPECRPCNLAAAGRNAHK